MSREELQTRTASVAWHLDLMADISVFKTEMRWMRVIQTLVLALAWAVGLKLFR